MINRFDGQYFFLSNFYPTKVVFEGIIFESAEHAYQAAKSTDPKVRAKFLSANSAKEAKALGRKIKLRPDWEQIKLDIMLRVVKSKFKHNIQIADKLLATGDEELVEGNNWNDTFWGVCDGVGENHLGKILMQVREEISANIK